MKILVYYFLIILIFQTGCIGMGGYTPPDINDPYVRIEVVTAAKGFYLIEDDLVLTSKIVATNEQLNELFMLVRIPLSSFSTACSSGQEFQVAFNDLTRHTDHHEALKILPYSSEDQNVLSIAAAKFYATDSVLVESYQIGTELNKGTAVIDATDESFHSVFDIKTLSCLNMEEVVIGTQTQIEELVN